MSAEPEHEDTGSPAMDPALRSAPVEMATQTTMSPSATLDPTLQSPPSNTPISNDTPAAKNPDMGKKINPKADAEKLTPKELKEQKKAEKLARRADSKTAAPSPQSHNQQGKKTSQSQGKGGKSNVPPNEGIVKTIYLSGGRAPPPKAIAKEPEAVSEAPRDKGLVGLLQDLVVEQNEKKKKAVFGLGNAHSEVHPAILTLGMQINENVLVGSTARCLGFLLAIKRVIEDYETPAGATLSRHLPGHYLSHQINYLLSARPMSTAMGNSIRWLKTEISKVSLDLTQEAAKKFLVEKVEDFIRLKITVADEMITKIVVKIISDGDVILTYSKSQIVEKSLLEAHARGIQFRVLVADSRPLMEGKNMLETLVAAGISCDYFDLSALDYHMVDATKVFLGAHSMMANGLCSRSGTSVVANCAVDCDVPVIVCCESLKFSDKIHLDGFAFNEIGDPDLVNISSTGYEPGPLQGWSKVENTHVFSLRYDMTPTECIDQVVCEHGSIPPSGVSCLMKIPGASEMK